MKHRQLISGLGLAALCLGGVGLAGAASSDAALATARATETMDGRITAVDAKAKTFVLLVKQSPNDQGPVERVTIAWTDRTECLLDGKASTPADAIKSGLEASVTHEEKVAIKVDSKTPKPQ